MRDLTAGLLFLLATTVAVTDASAADPPPVLPGTQPLTLEGDIASQLVDGVDRFLLEQTARSVKERGRHWKRDLSSPEAYTRSLEANRRLLAHILGVRDARPPFDAPQIVAGVGESPILARAPGYTVHAVRWPAFGDVHGEGLLLLPGDGRDAGIDVVAIPDADQLPEHLAGLIPTERGSPIAARLAERGCRVLVPVLIDREVKPRNGRSRLTSREFLYRSAFELGRHLIGYEVQKVLAGVDWFRRGGKDRHVGVIGWGEGGMLALLSGALDPRIDAVAVCGYFGPLEDVWQEPVDRNVFGLLEQFGGAEQAAMVAPRPLIIEASRGPEVTIPPGTGGAPGRLVTRKLEDVKAEVERARGLTAGLKPSPPPLELVVSGTGDGAFGTAETLDLLCKSLGGGKAASGSEPARALRPLPDAAARQLRQQHEIDRHNQWLLTESAYVRKEYFARLDTKSADTFRQSIEPYRQAFREEVIGRFDEKPLPPAPRTRKKWETPRWVGYEVVLDVVPDVIAYGVLLLPRDLKPGEKRPVVVCQHGLEGRPTDVFTGDHRAYHDYAAKLAERGFITFAPQNLYLFQDRFRTLQRKANPLKKTLFSVIVPQHQQIVDWLKTLPGVDPERIAFYGLSYGGKSAMRIPALVTDYCLSICSADFNEWVWKNASTRSPYSYVWTGEYEIFEFDLGSTFNYAEMAALIAPRPFMVERGHFDGVSSDEAVAYEFAKVRHLYQARLGLGDRCEIEFFVGPHTINGKGTFAFLHRHLNWPEPAP